MPTPAKHAPVPPTWISKPLRAMVPDELADLRAALCRENPPDAPLLRSVTSQLALYTALRAPGRAAGGDDESDDWAWSAEP